MVAVGRIVRPHGNKGHVVVAPETDFGSERFRAGATLLVMREEHIAPVIVAASREQDGRWIVGLEGVTSIDAAEALRGLELKIPPEALRPPGPDAYYAHDLVGCRVETVGGRPVGTVGHVRWGSGAPLLEVTSAAGEVLIPLAQEICLLVDVAGKRIVIDPPEGLIDLNR